MGSIVLELQKDALNSDTPTSELLRKALAVSIKLSISELTSWIKNEINGYETGELPNYRKVRGTLRAFNPYKGWIPAQLNDLGDDELTDMINTEHFHQSISEIEKLIITYESDGFYSYLQDKRLSSVQGMFNSKFQFALKFSVTSLVPIVNHVRNAILNWSLELEQNGVLGEGFSFSQEEVKKAHMSTVSIHNFQGVLGNVENSQLSQHLNLNDLKVNDFERLASVLSDNFVHHDDIEELKKAIDSDGERSGTDKFGERVSSWIGRMVAKAADGSWAVGIGTAANLLGSALGAYYGIN
ncbi:hypothetical protein FMH15_21470 [Vibrio alginolyticus]|nr:hypothetical protein [Vibrio alginolyticus]TNZ87101.1 hypothetical protein CGK37_25290 [Vibrio parahaemolyticus]TOA08359.1 hypothetical protein CGK34_24940 [Vibrio parahaemolyticus]